MEIAWIEASPDTLEGVRILNELDEERLARLLEDSEDAPTAAGRVVRHVLERACKFSMDPSSMERRLREELGASKGVAAALKGAWQRRTPTLRKEVRSLHRPPRCSLQLAAASHLNKKETSITALLHAGDSTVELSVPQLAALTHHLDAVQYELDTILAKCSF